MAGYQARRRDVRQERCADGKESSSGCPPQIVNQREPRANHAMHGALTGHSQSAIARFPPQVRVFGEYIYAANRGDDTNEAAEGVVFGMVRSKCKRLVAGKRERFKFVLTGLMRRYRFMHKGGQSANGDPFAKPKTFRSWLRGEYGVRMESCA